MTALIVDDEEDICKLITSILGKEEVDCLTSNSSIEGEKIAVDRIFDYYFLDINLPDGNGLDIIGKIKEVNKSACIVMISAFDGHEERSRAEYYGADKFISKPFTKSDILNTLK